MRQMSHPIGSKLVSGEVQVPNMVDQDEQPTKEGVSRVVILGWFAPNTFDQERHFDEFTSWPSHVDSFHGVSQIVRVGSTRSFSAFCCAFVRVWLSDQLLGISFGDCCGPYLQRISWRGADQRVLVWRCSPP